MSAWGIVCRAESTPRARLIKLREVYSIDVYDKSRLRRASWVAGISGVACAVALTAAWARWDFKQWLLLGKGGLPSSGKGWLRVTQMRLQARNPFQTAHLEGLRGEGNNVVLLSTLTPRGGVRPRVGAHPVPHRQLDQRISTELSSALQQVFDEEVSAQESTVEYALSFFEKHTLAITCRAPLEGALAEIAHVHALDGSMHMVLSPRDAVSAVRLGWAELHGLAGKAMKLPATYVMVYAPRSSEDLVVIRSLLRAAIAYRTGAISMNV